MRARAIAAAVLLAACEAASSPDPANATYFLENESVTLAGGRAEREAAPGSATRIVVSLAEQRATGDVDGDGRPDTVVVLLRQPGGSGTFLYVAALLNRPNAIRPTNAVLLGDRVRVTAVRLEGTTIAVDLLDRQPGEALSASPSVPVTRRFVVRESALAETR